MGHYKMMIELWKNFDSSIFGALIRQKWTYSGPKTGTFRFQILLKYGIRPFYHDFFQFVAQFWILVIFGWTFDEKTRKNLRVKRTQDVITNDPFSVIDSFYSL